MEFGFFTGAGRLDAEFTVPRYASFSRINLHPGPGMDLNALPDEWFPEIFQHLDFRRQRLISR